MFARSINPSDWIVFNNLLLDRNEAEKTCSSNPILKEIPEFKSFIIPFENSNGPKLDAEETSKYLLHYAKNYSFIKHNYNAIKKKVEFNEISIKKIVKIYAEVICPLPSSTLYKRDFPLLSSHCDKIWFSNEYSHLFTEKENRDFNNYLINNSNCHYRNRIVSSYFTPPYLSFKDEEIIRVHESTLDSSIQSPYYKGHIDKNKHLFLQHRRNGSNSSCISMLLSDKLKRFISPEAIKLNEIDLSNQSNALAKIENDYGVKIEKNYATNLNNIKTIVKIHGSIYFNINDPCFTSRSIIIDEVNGSEFSIRDPFHGWGITITEQALSQVCNFRNANGGLEYVRIVSSAE